MYNIKYMHGARQNLLEIEKNLDAKNTRLTDKILLAINKRIQSLQEMLLRYQAYPHNPRYRWTGVHNYMIFYKVVGDSRIEIHRILHGARDIERLMSIL
ncbi:MAG: type II toxin-antitoxin system RelE/ParE family toxin [Defluviitaleaceae bacterium]|nr:type II toxin-antitoxin system RelE/ParE family toxin [Defluviitaleaceae bacterium]